MWGSVQIWIASIVLLFQKPSCCPMNPCSLSVDAVVGCVGMHGYPVLLISSLYCLLVFTYSGLQWSLGLSNVHLGAVLARNLVDHFLPLLFRHLRCTLTSCCFNVLWGLEDRFYSKRSTGLLNLLAETSHVGEVEYLSGSSSSGLHVCCL